MLFHGSPLIVVVLDQQHPHLLVTSDTQWPERAPVTPC